MDSDQYIRMGLGAMALGLLCIIVAAYAFDGPYPLLAASLPVVVGFRLLGRGISSRQ